MNRERLWLLTYLAAVVALTLVHDVRVLAAAFSLALLAAGAPRWRLLRRALVALVVFNLGVSLAFAAMEWWQGQAVGEALLRMNLRVTLLVFLGFWLVSRIDLLRALTGWPTLSLLATLAIGQIRVYRRMIDECRLAFASRNLDPPRLVDTARQAAAQSGALLDKSLANAGEVSLAMRSRGAFDA